MRISTQHYACGFCCCCFLVWTVWGASSPSFSTSALATATSLASKRPLKRLLLNELDSKAKPWWYGWTCKSIFHIISHWLVEHGDRMTRCGQCCQWFAREVKEVLLELSGCILHLYNRNCSGNEKPCYQHRAFSCFSAESTFSHSALRHFSSQFTGRWVGGCWSQWNDICVLFIHPYMP